MNIWSILFKDMELSIRKILKLCKIENELAFC